MLKNIFLYRVKNSLPISISDTEEALYENRFVECGASQEQSFGWVAPRGGAHDALLECVDNEMILRLMVESKSVPAAVIKRKTDERIEKLEQETGRKPGKKERKEIAEDAKLSLLPMAFAKRSASIVWISLADGLLAIEASSQSRADEVVTALVHAIDGIKIEVINTAMSPSSAMSNWLTTQEAPADFTVDRECELKAADESKAVVKYARHALDIEEVRQHVTDGKLPTKLAMTWDDRVSFVLTEGLQIKKIELLDVVMTDSLDRADDDAHSFDTDVAIFTGEMRKLIPSLLDALGGEMIVGAAEAAE